MVENKIKTHTRKTKHALENYGWQKKNSVFPMSLAQFNYKYTLIDWMIMYLMHEQLEFDFHSMMRFDIYP